MDEILGLFAMLMASARPIAVGPLSMAFPRETMVFFGARAKKKTLEAPRPFATLFRLCWQIGNTAGIAGGVLPVASAPPCTFPDHSARHLESDHTMAPLMYGCSGNDRQCLGFFMARHFWSGWALCAVIAKIGPHLLARRLLPV